MLEPLITGRYRIRIHIGLTFHSDADRGIPALDPLLDPLLISRSATTMDEHHPRNGTARTRTSRDTDPCVDTRRIAVIIQGIVINSLQIPRRHGIRGARRYDIRVDRRSSRQITQRSNGSPFSFVSRLQSGAR